MSTHSSAELNALQHELCYRIDVLMDELGVPLTRIGDKYVGPCPIHGGKNRNALTLYVTGHTVPGYWQCYTNGCERFWKRTILGFVRGVLTRRDPKTTFDSTVAWCNAFVERQSCPT